MPRHLQAAVDSVPKPATKKLPSSKPKAEVPHLTALFAFHHLTTIGAIINLFSPLRTIRVVLFWENYLKKSGFLQISEARSRLYVDLR